MNEEVKSTDKEKKHVNVKVIIGVVVALVIAAVGISFAVSNMNGKDTTCVATAEYLDTYVELEYVGEVQPNETRLVYSMVKDVKVLDVLVSDGDYVHKGDALVILDSNGISFDIKEKELELAQKKQSGENELALAKLELETLQKSIKKGNNSEILACKTAMDAAQAEYDAISNAWDRAVSLKNSGYEPELVAAQNAVYEAQVALSASMWVNREEGASAGPDVYTNMAAVNSAQKSLEAISNKLDSDLADYSDKFDAATVALANAKATYNAAINNAKVQEKELTLKVEALENGTDIEKLQLELDKLNAELENYTVRAQSDGYISSINIKTGDTTDSNSMMSILNYDTLKVVFGVDEYSISRFSVENPVKVYVNALDKYFDGVISKISNVAEKRNDISFVDVTVTFDADVLISSGLGATVFTVPMEEERQLCVPADAVFCNRDTGLMSVTVLYEDGSQEIRPVTLGGEADGYIAIISGVEDGEQVIYEEVTGEDE